MPRSLRRGLRLVCLAAVLAVLFIPAGPAAHAQSAPGLAGYWTFDEGSGRVSADRSGHGNTATLGPGAGFTPTVTPVGAPNPAALALTTNQGSYATAPGNGIDDLQRFTITFWYRGTALPPPGTTVSLLTLGNRKAGVELYTFTNAPDQSPDIRFYTTVNGVEYLFTQGGIGVGTYPTDGAYHLFVASYDGTTRRASVDNHNYGLTLDPGGLHGTVATGNGVTIGDSFAGAIDDVRIYNYALSQDELTDMYVCSRAEGISPDECRALAALYSQAGGRGWLNRGGWMQNNQPCTWYGVLCNNGHVFVLSLPNNNLRGTIPPQLGQLSGLTVLNLVNNHLADGIPYELGQLSSLKTLDLYNNQLNGTIPSTLGSLSALQTLRLAGNALRGAIPPQLANLNARLTTLDLSFNMLSAADPTLLTFLNAKQPDWAATQTVPPTDIRATVRSNTSVALSWTPIAYTGDGGGYDVLAALQTGGNYTRVGSTADKSAGGLTLNGLAPGASYSFILRSHTPPHGAQANDLMSDGSDPLAVSLHATSNATITIRLDTQPDSRANFSFSGTLGAFTLDDATPQDSDAYTSSKTFSVPSGVYTVTEQLVTGYLDANISCDPPAGTIADLARHQIVISADPGANITCTFVAQRASRIIVGVYDDHNRNHRRNSGDEWLNGWKIQLHSPYTPEVATQATSGEGQTRFVDLFPGSYTVCETLQSGWQTVTPGTIDPTYHAPCTTVVVAPGKAVWVRFGNSATATAAARPDSATASADVVVCALPPTDDAGRPIGPEREPWEEEETPARLAFVPLLGR